LYPNGDTADADGNIGLFFCVANTEDTTFKVRYQFGLMNNNDQKIQYLRNVVKRNGHEFADNLGCGFSKFLSHAELFDASKNYVVDGQLTIACKVR